MGIKLLTACLSSTCAVMNTLHMAIVHRQREIVELLLKSGYEANNPAACHCKGNCSASGNIPMANIMPRCAPSITGGSLQSSR